MKKIIELKLKFFARLILKKYKPKVIAITGSVGKTSTKEAIYPVIKSQFQARKNIKNYNNEIGLPLTIINARAQGKNIFGWAAVFFKATKLILFKDKNYPKVLILEMGIDHPGDMDYLLKIVKPDIALMTLVGKVHVKYFKSVENLHTEKAKLTDAVKDGGWAIFNYDNKYSKASAEKSTAQKLTYGLAEGADVRASEIRFNFEQDRGRKEIEGMKFKLSYRGETVPVKIDRAISLPAVYSALGGACAGIASGLSLKQIAASLQNYVPPKGRMNIIDGNKKSTILDDSYNAEPESMKAALDMLKKVPGSRKLAVLGDMLELGKYSEEAHKEIGQIVAVNKVDKLIVVGERSRDIARGAKESGMRLDDIFHFPFSEEAAKFLERRLREDDVVLVKGSQGIRMEKIVKEVMAEPLRAKELLVRQDESWLK